MKSLLIAALVCVPIAAQAQAPKQVEVINDPLPVEVTNPVTIVDPVAVDITEPLAVEVVNPAPPSPHLRWHVGFTSATYTGDMGGHFGVRQKCQLEFPNSHMCSTEEVAAPSIPSPLVGNAWVLVLSEGEPHPWPPRWNFAAHPLQLCAGNCNGWRSASNDCDGTVINADRSQKDRFSCGGEHPIACCALVP